MNAGTPYHIRPTGPSDIRRIEAGILNWGADMTLENNVYEVGLERLVDADKQASWIGRDALLRVRNEGVRRKLAGIEIEGGRLSFNASKWPVSAAGKTLGRVTSAIWSPRLAKNIGYAMVPVAQSAPGTTLTVDIPGAGQRKATVVAMPFIDPAKEIPKG
jgi:aminomethyltransferase